MFFPTIGRDFEREFGFDTARDLLENAMGKMDPKRQMRMELRELEDSYIMSLELPGFKKEDISVECQNGFLTIKAESQATNEEKDKFGRVTYSERSFGSCQRTFQVGDKVDDTKISAKFENGELTLTLGKKVDSILKKSKIDIF